MKRFTYALVLVLALVAGSVPAIADHIVEPTTPISETGIEIYSYPNFSTALTACDGTEIPLNVDGTVAKDIRVETFVDSPARQAGNPSEHWTETIALFIVTKLGQPNEVEKYEWAVDWNHSNIPPHASGGIGDNGWESSQNNQNLRRYAPGTILRFKSTVTGLESGLQFETSCTFKVG